MAMAPMPRDASFLNEAILAAVRATASSVDLSIGAYCLVEFPDGTEYRVTTESVRTMGAEKLHVKLARKAKVPRTTKAAKAAAVRLAERVLEAMDSAKAGADVAALQAKAMKSRARRERSAAALARRNAIVRLKLAMDGVDGLDLPELMEIWAQFQVEHVMSA